jgi:hypothetical protein
MEKNTTSLAQIQTDREVMAISAQITFNALIAVLYFALFLLFRWCSGWHSAK